MNVAPLSFDVGSLPAIGSLSEGVSKEAKGGDKLNLRLPSVVKHGRDEEEKNAAVQKGKTDQLNGNLLDSGLEFSVDQDTGQTIIKMYDRTSGKVVRQLPPEETLEFLKKLAEQNERKGVLVSKKL